MEEVFFSFFVGYGVAIHSLAGSRIEVQTVESPVSKAPGILRGNRVDTDAKISVRQGLQYFDNLVAYADGFGQVLGIANASEARFFFGGAQAGEVVLVVP